MTEWRSFHIHYSDVDDLILNVIQPFFASHELELDRRFWERHYLGGVHVRIRLRAPEQTVSRVGHALVSVAERYLAAKPSADRAYSPRRASALYKQEGGTAATADLTYKNNVVVEHPYPPPHDVFVSRDAAALAEDFRHDVMYLATQLMQGDRRRDQLLRLFFLQPLIIFAGDLPRGCTSYRSHWEGFAARFPSVELLDRIQNAYDENRDMIIASMLDVHTLYDKSLLSRDAVLLQWRDLIATYTRRAQTLLEQGKELTPQPATLEDARFVRDGYLRSMVRENAFVRKLWSDERFFALLQYENRFLVPRVMVNLLYGLLATVGLTAIDKMTLSYFAFRAAEDHYGRDLQDDLQDTITRIIRDHGHHLEVAVGDSAASA